MSSRSATVLVIFVVACIAFCLASVFASMTGPISILPNDSDSGSILDNLSVIENADTDNYQSYNYDDSDDYSQNYDDSQDSEPQVETTVDNSADSSSNYNAPVQESNPQPTPDSQQSEDVDSDSSNDE